MNRHLSVPATRKIVVFTTGRVSPYCLRLHPVPCRPFHPLVSLLAVSDLAIRLCCRGSPRGGGSYYPTVLYDVLTFLDRLRDRDDLLIYKFPRVGSNHD